MITADIVPRSAKTQQTKVLNLPQADLKTLDLAAEEKRLSVHRDVTEDKKAYIKRGEVTPDAARWCAQS